MNISILASPQPQKGRYEEIRGSGNGGALALGTRTGDKAPEMSLKICSWHDFNSMVHPLISAPGNAPEKERES